MHRYINNSYYIFHLFFFLRTIQQLLSINVEKIIRCLQYKNMISINNMYDTLYYRHDNVSHYYIICIINITTIFLFYFDSKMLVHININWCTKCIYLKLILPLLRSVVFAVVYSLYLRMKTNLEGCYEFTLFFYIIYL